ncbi:MAG: flagellar hook-associated protein FlgL [bacterium]|nr:flagellar hook-associated protein FlgL [bacterium]
MNLRVTSNSFTDLAVRYSAVHQGKLAELQTQISSGLRFQRPSEAPIAFRQMATLNRSHSELSADRHSIEQATAILNATVQQIQEYSDAITSARNLAQRGIQSLDEDSRLALANEVEGLLKNVQAIGLSQFNGRYLFGGTRTDEPPFVFQNGVNDFPSYSARYVGASNRSQASIGQSIAVDTYYAGDEVFSNVGRQPTVLTGTTGARVGDGPDTAINRLSLTVSHRQTVYLGNSGVRPSADSPGNDSIIGVGSHKLTIVDTSGDGSAGQIRLNGGEAVTFSSADTHLRVESPSGQIVYVDTTAISPGFSGDVDIEAHGSLSLDGGRSSFDISFTENQLISHSESGQTVTIDSSLITRTGIDQLEFPGTANAFETLEALVADLRNSRELGPRELADSLNRRLADLEGLSKNAFALMGEQATTLRSLQTIGNRVDDLKLDVERQASELQATDIPQAVLQLRSSQSLLQVTYAVTAELTSMGLLQFLR